MDISIDQAFALCAVVDCGGYTQAAEKLNKSHSALVYLIKNFEAQCSFQIFDRQGYRNELTSQGRRVYLKSKEIILKVRELDQLCKQLNNKWEASIKIVLDGILPFTPLLEIYRKFKSEKIPTIVQTYTDFLQDVEKSFFNLDADLMISILPIKNNELKSFYLKPLKSILVAHSSHAIHKDNSRKTIQDLQSYDFLTIRGSVNKLNLSTSLLEESASFYLNDFSIKKEAILKKIGFGWLPEHMIYNELKTKKLLPVRWQGAHEYEIQPILYARMKSTGSRALTAIIENLTLSPLKSG